MSKPQILVFGSTGTVGIEVSKALAKKGVAFRAVVHSIEKADSIKKLGNNIEIVQVNVWQPESISKALEGINKVFLMTPPGQTASGFGIVDTIKKAGIKNIVKLSALGSDDPAFAWGKEHLDIEEHAKKQGLTITSIRPSSFHSNTFQDVPTIKQGAVYKAYGNARLNLISNKDIGEVIAKALTETGHEGKTYTLTGPDTLDTNEYAKIISQVIGKEVKYIPINDQELRKQAANFLPTAELVDGFSNMNTYFRNGGYDKHTNDVQNLLGHKGTTFQSFLEENKQAFQ